MHNDVMQNKTHGNVASIPVASSRYHVASVQRAITLIEALATPPHQFGVTELSRMVGQTKNQTFRLLQTLADDSVVVMDPGTKQYSLGYRLLEWGVVAQKSSPLVIAVSPVLDRLASSISETIVLTTFVDDQFAICIDKRESPQMLQISAKIGRRIPLHAGAGSKCLLAYSTSEFIDRFIATTSPLPRLTSATITCPEQLKEELTTIRGRGYSVSNEDLDEGACSVAAPIRDHLGSAVASVSIASPKTRFSDEEARRNSQEVMAAAEEASNHLKHRL